MDENNFSLPNIADGEDKSSPLKNRIRKNYRHIRKWAKRTLTNCFRIYDHEIPEYPLAIDFYDGRFCVQYFPRHREELEPSKPLITETLDALCSIFNTPKETIYWKTRIKREKIEQYEKLGDHKAFFNVLEYGLTFKVNLLDYLDTGLFLDHRETRKMVASLSQGKRVLNLFAYTCSFSLHAAAGGASFTKSVDMSNTYTQWGKDNFLLNSFSLKTNEIVRADCLKFLDDEIASNRKYDLIIVDPPTLSRSKKMDQFFDIQIDYVSLLKKALALLIKGGSVFFSTNSRKFSFDESLFPSHTVTNISEKTLPLDFHNKRIHRCWKLQ